MLAECRRLLRIIVRIRICRLYGVTSDYLLGLSEEDPLLTKKRREQFTTEDKKVLRLFEEFLIFKKAQKQ